MKNTPCLALYGLISLVYSFPNNGPTKRVALHINDLGGMNENIAD
jgi:hypothetical protein